MTNKEQAFKNIEGRIETIQNLSTEIIELIYVAGYNEAIEDAANKVNDELGGDETDAYYTEREIRKLKK